MPKAEVWWLENSMLIILDQVVDESTGDYVNSGLTVTAKVYDKNGQQVTFDDGGGGITTVMLTPTGSKGRWQKAVPKDLSTGTIAKGDQIKVVYEADGGTTISQGEWVARPEVRERAA